MPEVDYRVYKGVKTQLSNAWREGVLVDEKGWLWVKKSKLHSILRTSPQKANYLTMALNEEDKRYFHGELYICLLYTSPSPRDYAASRMPSSA